MGDLSAGGIHGELGMFIYPKSWTNLPQRVLIFENAVRVMACLRNLGRASFLTGQIR